MSANDLAQASAAVGRARKRLKGTLTSDELRLLLRAETYLTERAEALAASEDDFPPRGRWGDPY